MARRNIPMLIYSTILLVVIYKSATLVSDIKSTIRKYQADGTAYIFDTVGKPDADSYELSSSCLNDSDHSKIVSVRFQRDPQISKARGIKNTDVTMKPIHFPCAVTMPARPEDHVRAWGSLEWAAKNYGDNFRIQHVKVFEGSAEEALIELTKLAEYGRRFGKLVLKHPLK